MVVTSDSLVVAGRGWRVGGWFCLLQGEEGRGVRSGGRVTGEGGGLDLSRIFPNFLEMRRFCWYVDGPWLDGRMVLLSKL